MRSGLYPFFHIALLNDFGSFALGMSDNLFESAHCSTASPSLSVVVYLQRVLWLLKSPITMWGLILCPSGEIRYGSGGGLYRECTTTPGSYTVMNSTFSSSHTEMLFTFRPSLTKTELPWLLCGRSATSVIPGIFGLAWSLARCVSWRHRQWQCCILYNSDSMDALLADRPSTFADITVIAPEGLWLCTADMVWGIIHRLDVLEELVNNLTRWIGLAVLQGSRRTRFFYDPNILAKEFSEYFCDKVRKIRDGITID